MEIRIKTTNYEMPAATAAYLDEKIASLERLVHDEATRCEVEIGRGVGHSQQGDVWKAEIMVHQFGERFIAIAEEESVNAAIDIAKDEMLQQLRKGKDKNTSLVKRMGARLKRWARRGDIRSY
ncbi:MAG: ribosome-associated translation inhibitor RaiA [Patescibacteria group bacterium]